MSFNNSNTARFNNIMNSRVEVGFNHVGQVLQLMITGVTLGFYDEKLEAFKDIYNLSASKAPVMDSEWFKTGYANALALEASGDVDGARLIFDELMNKSTLTFSVINRDGKAIQFAKGERINAPIESAEAGDDKRQTVVVNKPYAVKTIIASKGRRFDAEVAVPATQPEATALATAEATA